MIKTCCKNGTVSIFREAEFCVWKQWFLGDKFASLKKNRTYGEIDDVTGRSDIYTALLPSTEVYTPLCTLMNLKSWVSNKRGRWAKLPSNILILICIWLLSALMHFMIVKFKFPNEISNFFKMVIYVPKAIPKLCEEKDLRGAAPPAQLKLAWPNGLSRFLQPTVPGKLRRANWAGLPQFWNCFWYLNDHLEEVHLEI